MKIPCILVTVFLLVTLDLCEAFLVGTTTTNTRFWKQLDPQRALISLPSKQHQRHHNGLNQQTNDNDAVLAITTNVIQVNFPEKITYRKLIEDTPCLLSEPFTIGERYDFRVKFYPCGHRARSGFGMGYKLLSSSKETKVGVYLQFLPRTPEQTVDAVFSLRLKGNQRMNPRFDLEWRAGMRFQADTNLKQGFANDFGANLMHTSLLPTFWGISDNNSDDIVPIGLEVEVQLFDHQDDSTITKHHHRSFWGDVRTSNVRVGNVVVPVLNKLSERPNMMKQGVYPGVEYRILRILENQQDDVFYHQPGVTYEMKPIYPLVKPLERPWPVSVPESDIPKLVTPNAYNAISALGSLATAILGLVVAFWVSSAVSLFYIPSRSMEPTLQIGDVLLVEKVRIGQLHRRDIVLFQPPSALQDIVAANGGRLNPRDLFVKRVAGLPGDSYNVKPTTGTVDVNGIAVQNQLCQAENGVKKFLPDESAAGSKVVPDDSVLVLGDCGNVSIDSRVWGPLPKAQLVGRPLVRVWPMDRMGRVQ